MQLLTSSTVLFLACYLPGIALAATSTCPMVKTTPNPPRLCGAKGHVSYTPSDLISSKVDATFTPATCAATYAKQKACLSFSFSSTDHRCRTFQQGIQFTAFCCRCIFHGPVLASPVLEAAVSGHHYESPPSNDFDYRCSYYYCSHYYCSYYCCDNYCNDK